MVSKVFAFNLLGKEAEGGEKPAHYANFFPFFSAFILDVVSSL